MTISTDLNAVLKQLAVAEAAVAAQPFLTVLNNLKNSDGSTATLTGQGMVLQGELLAAAPTIQKVGVVTLASDLINLIQGWIASATPPTSAAATAAPATPAAA